MAQLDEQRKTVRQLIQMAEGYMSDAEFRDEYETRQIRYLQAISNALIAISIQNDIIIGLLQREGA